MYDENKMPLTPDPAAPAPEQEPDEVVSWYVRPDEGQEITDCYVQPGPMPAAAAPKAAAFSSAPAPNSSPSLPGSVIIMPWGETLPPSKSARGSTSLLPLREARTAVRRFAASISCRTYPCKKLLFISSAKVRISS